MSSNAVELRAAGLPARIGQATAVEQSRAVAEVQAAVIVAQQCPRSVSAAIRNMEETCRQPELAKRAFFRYSRGGDPITGASVHLARELARCWGNVQHGITELSRDDAHGESEMQAWAWDVETNTRSSNTFIVPHRRDTKQGVRELKDMRDIYENNANNGARRLREAIFSVLPAWYVARAESLCQATIEDGGGEPLPVRITKLVLAMEKLRVSPGRIAAKFGYASVDELTATDLAQLAVVYDSLKQGTVSVDEEFPAEGGLIKPDDLAPPQNVPPAQPSSPPAAPQVPPSTADAGGTRSYPALLGWIDERLDELGVTSPLDKLRAVSLITGKQVKSPRGITHDEAVKVADTLDAIDGPSKDGLLADLATKDDPRGEADDEQ